MLVRIKVLLFFLTCLQTFYLSANHYVGLRGGAGISMVYFTPGQNQELILLPIHAGVVYKYLPTLESRGLVSGWERYLGVTAELNFMQKGFTFKDTIDKKHFSSFIELPVLAHGRIPLGKYVELTVMGGLYVGYYMKNVLSYTYNDIAVSETFQYTNNKNWEYGGGGGLGLNIKINRFQIMWDVRFMSSFAYLFKQELTRYNSVSQVLYSGITILFDISKKKAL